MTGHLKIQLVQDKKDKCKKWIVWERNITKNNFYHIISFTRSIVENEMRIGKAYFNQIERLATDESIKDVRERYDISEKLPTDVLRDFTIDEYILLGRYLKYCGYRYNKKKDEFIKINKK